jgi:hypothetical protein
MAVTAAALFAPPVTAHDFTAGSLKIDHPWARATPKGASVGGGYMKITNNGTAPDRLVGGASDVSKRFEVHEMTMQNGVMKMRPVTRIPIPAGGKVELKPGSFHIMLLDLKRDLKPGDTVPVTLGFEHGGELRIEAAVR